MSRPKREQRAITIAEIEQQFALASYWFGETWCPAVHETEHGYGIRVIRAHSFSSTTEQVSYDYFEVYRDGTVTMAPRGWARAYKPGRVVDIEAAVKRFATPWPGATRIEFGGVR